MPRRCLYDNAKVITLGRDEEKRPVWNERLLDFSLRVGFEAWSVPSLPGPDQGIPLHPTRPVGRTAQGDGRPRREAVAVQVPVGEVELRSLDVYELATVGGAR